MKIYKKMNKMSDITSEFSLSLFEGNELPSSVTPRVTSPCASNRSDMGTGGKNMSNVGTAGYGCLGLTPAEQHEALQHGSASTSTSSSSVMDDFVFGNLYPSSVLTESTDSVSLQPGTVDPFASSSSDSTPLLGLGSFNQNDDPKTWVSLFDDDIPVRLDETQESKPFSSDIGLLPTPVLDDIKVDGKIVNEAMARRKFGSEHSGKEIKQSPYTVPEAMSPAPSPTASVKSSAGRKRGSIIKPDKVDRLGVITYNRKQRSVPLSPVVPESDDPVALKRARNTEAARRSRARKLERMNQLEVRVEELLQKNSQLEEEVTKLRALLTKQSS